LTAVRRAIIAVFVLAFAAGCGARTSPPLVQPGALEAALSPLEQLRRDLQQLFTHTSLDHANWGVKVESLRTGETLYSHNPFKFLLPASNQKLLTAAVAAERLGWDYRFTTRVLATGTIDADGMLQGDLVVVGDGDPSINPRHAERWGVFNDWAAALRSRGVRAINGRIVGDDNAFEEPGLGQGWTWENLPYGFGTAIGALQYNENQIAVSITPGAAGTPAAVTATPAVHGMVIDGRATTVAAGAPNTVDIFRLPGSSVLYVRGDIAADAKPVTITASVENATRMYVNALKEALVRNGIDVSGDAVDIDELHVPTAVAATTELIVDRSPPLAEIIDVCLKWSRNEYAETLLRAVAPAGRPSTTREALEVMRGQLLAWGIPPAFVVPMDGSGLSRQDYVTPHALTLLLTYLWMEPKHQDVFRSTLPVAGMSGSLAERMKATPLEGRVWAKTGTLSNVRGLSGYLLTRLGEPVVFSMISNNFQVPTAEIDAAMENALLRVFEYAPGSNRHGTGR
jgi:D-alanyl-D-alanine carboxypeptidase/D-alanyl-D-alanine-endopeptidase (penicillin-binding protein 4)